jgi:hypothetical protein
MSHAALSSALLVANTSPPASVVSQTPAEMAAYIMSLPSQDPEYRRIYAQFSRALKNRQTPPEVPQLFKDKAQYVFKQWLTDEKSFSSVIAQIEQTRLNSQEVEEDYAFRTPSCWHPSPLLVMSLAVQIAPALGAHSCLTSQLRLSHIRRANPRWSRTAGGAALMMSASFATPRLPWGHGGGTQMLRISQKSGAGLKAELQLCQRMVHTLQ